MIALGVFCLMVGGGRSPVLPDTAAPTDTLSARALTVPTDTPHTRPKVIVVSDWYARRLTMHRWVAYGTIPVFAVEWAAGKQLWDKGAGAPTWAKTTHRVGATMLAGMFTVNTVTGAWNWWDSRSLAKGRAVRTIHALSMITADAAFTYAGAKLSNEAETNNDKRRLHRTIALSAMGLTVVSEVAMKILNR